MPSPRRFSGCESSRPFGRFGRVLLRVGRLAAVLGAALRADDAWAYSVEVDATVIGQGYTLNTADAGAAAPVDRRRLTTYLGLQLGDFGRKDRDGLPTIRDQFGVTLQLRVDMDFGDYFCNIGRAGYGLPLGCLDPPQGVRTDPELLNHRPELLLAYAEGRRLGGFLDVRLGRQIIWDLLDLRGLDGGWLRVHTPLYVAFEVFGGISPNGALSIDSPLYVMDGTSRNLRFAPDDSRQQYSALQPTLGASIVTSDLPEVQSRLSYRRTFSATASAMAPGCEGRACAPPSGIIEERLSYTIHGRLWNGRLHAWGGLRYDVLNGRFDEGQIGLRGTVGAGQHLSLAYSYSAPTWDGDSIFNVFAAEAYQQVRAVYNGRADVKAPAGGELAWQASAFARLFQSSAAGDMRGVLSTAAGGDFELRYRRPQGFVRLDGYCDGGYGGLRAGGDLSGRLLLFRDRIGLEGRFMYLYWADDERLQSRSHGLALQGGIRWTILSGALLHLLAEDSIDRFYKSQLRLMALLDISFLLGPDKGRRSPPGLLNAGFGAFPAGRLLPGVLP